MLHLIQPLIPKPLHRLALRLGYRLRNGFRHTFRLPCAGVSLVASDGSGQVLLVRHSYGPRRWSLPGGGLARGEDPHIAARRELFEELGCSADRLELIGTVEETHSGAPHTAYVFALEVRDRPRPDGREVVEARFFAPEALPENLGALSRQRIAAWQSWLASQ